jgi:hypothetical protein
VVITDVLFLTFNKIAANVLPAAAVRDLLVVSFPFFYRLQVW